MTFETIDNRRDPQTEEFEKLEFLPEAAAPAPSQLAEATGEIDFRPEPAPPDEPPVSFDPAPDIDPDPAPQSALDFFGAASVDLDLEGEIPFELFGTSLFSDDSEDDLDDDLAF
jgi:hypothetical protein